MVNGWDLVKKSGSKSDLRKTYYFRNLELLLEFTNEVLSLVIELNIGGSVNVIKNGLVINLTNKESGIVGENEINACQFIEDIYRKHIY